MQDQFAVKNRQLLSGRNQIYAVGFNEHPLFRSFDRHFRTLGKEFDHETLIIGREVLDDYKPETTINRHFRKEHIQCFEPACGCTYTYEKIGSFDLIRHFFSNCFVRLRL